MENQCVDPGKKRRKNREKKEKKLFSSFKYLYIREDIHRYIYIYIDRYIFPLDINQKKTKKKYCKANLKQNKIIREWNFEIRKNVSHANYLLSLMRGMY
jgi:hypothetical protein